jgi:hypothetical protein
MILAPAELGAAATVPLRRCAAADAAPRLGPFPAMAGNASVIALPSPSRDGVQHPPPLTASLASHCDPQTLLRSDQMVGVLCILA